MDDINEAVLLAILEARKRQRMTQHDAARRIGWSQKSWSRFESGFLRLTLEAAHIMACTVGVRLWAIIKDFDPNEKN